MKTVMPGEEVPHVWAHGGQPWAQNRGKTIFADGAIIYSYGTHFPMGVRIGSAFVLTDERASVTTSKHQSWVRGALPRTPYYVPSLTDSDCRLPEKQRALAIAHTTREEVRRMLADACKLRKTEKRYALADKAQYYHAQMLGLARDIKQVKAIQKIMGSIRAELEEALEGAIEYRLKLATARAKRSETERKKGEERARRIREQRAREWAEWAPQRDQAIQAWRDGGIFDGRINWREDGSTRRDIYLRLKDGEVQTSQHATFLVEHAIKLFPLWKSLVAHGREYVRNGHTIHLGPYALDKIDAQGNITAGCHYIQRDEVEHFARVLGLMPNDTGEYVKARYGIDLIQGEAIPRTVHDLLPGDSFTK